MVSNSDESVFKVDKYFMFIFLIYVTELSTKSSFMAGSNYIVGPKWIIKV
jgi:hypothetical protein